MSEETDLTAFLARYTVETTETETWGDTLTLLVCSYASDILPPEAWITSVRSVVLSGDKVMVVSNADGAHVLPGGRVEPGETLLDTLHREVLEETGWTVRMPTLLGFMHFRHLTPKPPDYPYPYPDFVQVVYCAIADQFYPQKRVIDDYETQTRFLPVAEAQRLPLPGRDRFYLQIAIQQTRQT